MQHLDDELEELVRLATYPELSQELQLYILRIGNSEVREALASNLGITDDTCRALLAYDEAKYLIHNPNTPPDVLVHLAVRDDPEVSHELIRAHPRARKKNRNRLGIVPSEPTRMDKDVEKFTRSHLEKDWDDITHDPVEWVTGMEDEIEDRLWRPGDNNRLIYLERRPETARDAHLYLLESWSARQPSAPDYVLDRIVSKLAPLLESRRPVYSAFPDHPDVDRFFHESDDSDNVAKILRFVALHQNTSSETLKMLADLKWTPVRQAVARNPLTTAPTLKGLVRLDDREIDQSVASHPSHKVRNVYEKLVGRNDEEVLTSLAGNPHLPDWQLDQLLPEASEGRLAALAGNTSYTPHDADRFTGHGSTAIRVAAAGNKNTSPEALRRLASDPSATVRFAVATNPATPESTLVRLHATRRDTHTGLAGNPATPETILIYLSDEPDNHLPLARNPHLPIGVQERLVTGAPTIALRALAKNRAASPEILHALSQKPDSRVLRSVAWNDNTTDETLQELTQDHVPWFTRFSARRRLLNTAGGLDQLPEVTLDDFDFTL